MAIRVLSCLALFVLASATTVAAEDADKLVAQLADADFEVREAAQRKLRELGAAARPALEKAAESKDAEQRQRVDFLLREIRRDELWSPPLLTFEPGERDVKAAFEELAKQSGNPFNWGRSSSAFSSSVAFSGNPAGYWETLDDLCRQSNTAVQFYDDPHGLGATLIRGSPGMYPTAYAGPVRFRLQSIRQSLQKEIHFGDAEPDVQDSWSIALQMHWEQRTPLCRHRGRPTILELKTDAGEELKPVRPERARDVMMPIVRRQREINFSLTHQPPTRPAKKFAAMRFALDLTIVGDFATLEVPADEPGAAAEADGYRLQVDHVRKDVGGTSVFVRIVRAEALDTANNTPELVDERVLLISGGKPIEYNVQRTLGGRTQVQYTLTVGQPLSADAKVQLKAPTLRSPRRVEFDFKDVPMP